tara:strand:- start:599 stop:865 length:267 start_codon:yes stop_codon:yes gene_type:complete
MGIKEFLGLHEEDQWDEFWDKCVFLAHFPDLEKKHHLYRLFDFYVELTSDHSGMFPVLNAFESGPRLDKYRNMNLDKILGDLRINFPE